MLRGRETVLTTNRDTMTRLLTAYGVIPHLTMTNWPRQNSTVFVTSALQERFSMVWYGKQGRYEMQFTIIHPSTTAVNPQTEVENQGALQCGPGEPGHDSVEMSSPQEPTRLTASYSNTHQQGQMSDLHQQYQTVPDVQTPSNWNITHAHPKYSNQTGLIGVWDHSNHYAKQSQHDVSPAHQPVSVITPLTDTQNYSDSASYPTLHNQFGGFAITSGPSLSYYQASPVSARQSMSTPISAREAALRPVDTLEVGYDQAWGYLGFPPIGCKASSGGSTGTVNSASAPSSFWTEQPASNTS